MCGLIIINGEIVPDMNKSLSLNDKLLLIDDYLSEPGYIDSSWIEMILEYRRMLVEIEHNKNVSLDEAKPCFVLEQTAQI